MFKSKAKSIAIYLLVFAVWILVFESLSRLWIEYFGDPLHKTYRVIEPDSKIGWRLKRGLNTEFYDKALFTNNLGFRSRIAVNEKNLSQFKLVTLGPSSAFGWGVDNQNTYTHQFSKLIEEFEERPFESLNLSQIGFTSLQGVLLSNLDDVKSLSPEVVIISFGVNDIDRFRFFYPSNQEDNKEFFEPKDPRQNSVLSAINTSGFFNIISRAIQKIRLRFDCGTLQSVPPLRVNFNDFEKNFEKLITKFRRNGATVLLVNTPLLISGKEGVDNTKSHYEQMTVAAKSKDCLKATKHLDLAREREPARIIKDVKEINTLLDRLSSKLNVPVVDAFGLLENQKGHYVDPVHPSKSGHLIIAKALIKLFMEHRSKVEQ